MAIYIFVYGSLINKGSTPVRVSGLKRSLNVDGKNHLVFGVKNSKSAVCNGVLFKVTDSQLAKLIKREMLYTLKPLAKERIEFYNKKQKIQFQPTDQLFYFHPLSDHVLTKKQLAAKPQALTPYVKTILKTAATIGDDFLHDFLG
jgi:hypothetical protein